MIVSKHSVHSFITSTIELTTKAQTTMFLTSLFISYQASVIGHEQNGKYFPFCESKGSSVTLLFSVAHY